MRDNEFYAVNNDTLNDMLASGYVLGTGDKYARYYTAKGYADLLAMQSGKTMGIGVIAVNDPSSGYARITQVYAENVTVMAIMAMVTAMLTEIFRFIGNYGYDGIGVRDHPPQLCGCHRVGSDH